MVKPDAEVAVLIGTAGWTIPRASAPRFASDGTHLERYARVFGCAEINTSFHRPHAAATYAAWRERTPPAFRFSVKMPRAITHDLRLTGTRRPLEEFLRQCDGLAEKRGPILVQLPPSLAFTTALADRFFRVLRGLYDGPLALEPRHASWFSPAAEPLLYGHRIARLAADPAPVPGVDAPGGWPALQYFRLHGSPHRYWSSYGPEALAAVAAALTRRGVASEHWCIFDNTAAGAAMDNAWDLQHQLSRAGFRQ